MPAATGAILAMVVRQVARREDAEVPSERGVAGVEGSQHSSRH